MFSNWSVCWKNLPFHKTPKIGILHCRNTQHWIQPMWLMISEVSLAREISLWSPTFRWHWVCRNSEVHFQHKCLVTAGLSEPAVGTVPGQMLSVGRVAASGFSGPPTRSASFCSICNAVAQWPGFKDKVMKLRNCWDFVKVVLVTMLWKLTSLFTQVLGSNPKKKLFAKSCS